MTTLNNTRVNWNLEIHGIPEEEDEDVGQIFLQVATKIDADVREEDIDICHRLNKKEGKPRPIIVKFNNYDAKYELYSKRLRLRKLDFMDSLGTERVSVNENLTSRRSLLFSKVRKKGERQWQLDHPDKWRKNFLENVSYRAISSH